MRCNLAILNWRIERKRPFACCVKSCYAIKVVLLLALVGFCLFQGLLRRQSETYGEYVDVVISLQWPVLVYLVVWCAAFLFLTFGFSDLLLVGLVVVSITAFFSGDVNQTMTNALLLMFCVTFGKGIRCALKVVNQRSFSTVLGIATRNQESPVKMFFIGLIVFLAVASWWHLNMPKNPYHGLRWMGLWNDPNIYGMLMGTGVALATGLLLADERWKIRDGIKDQVVEISEQKWLTAVSLIAAGMMGVGLVMSYSRGAWVGTSVSLLYLAWSYRKLRWRYVVPGLAVVAAVVFSFWGATPDSAPWYMKRMDFGRPSAQHRVAAWKAGFEIMRDHPFGVGWNKTVKVYQSDYSPPEYGAAAIATNSYLMLGTQLGWPGLTCFVGYVALCLGSPKPKVQSAKSENGTVLDIGHGTLDSSKTACRAGAVFLLVAFWFDGGLFTLATASVFWVLLELGKV